MQYFFPMRLAHAGARGGARPSPGRGVHFVPSPWGRGASLYAYLSIYLALEWASQFHAFEFRDIALWNPSPAASLVLLLTRGLSHAPLLFVAGLLSSVYVHGDPHSFLGTDCLQHAACRRLYGAGHGLAEGLDFSLAAGVCATS